MLRSPILEPIKRRQCLLHCFSGLHLCQRTAWVAGAGEAAREAPGVPAHGLEDLLRGDLEDALEPVLRDAEHLVP